MRFEARRWPLRPSDRHLLRHGPNRPDNGTTDLKVIHPQCNGFGEDIAGTGPVMAFQCRPKTVLLLVQRMVQNNWPEAAIRNALMDERNVSGTWLRRQDDPDARLAEMLATVNRNLLPYLPMRERDRRILALLDEDRHWSKKALRMAVGHARDDVVNNDIARLVTRGSITDETTKHGQVLWHKYSLVVARSVASDLALTTRQVLARKLARVEAMLRLSRLKGGRSLPGGETPGLVSGVDEEDVIRAEQAQREAERLTAELAGPSWWLPDPLQARREQRLQLRRAGRERAMAAIDRLLDGIDPNPRPEPVPCAAMNAFMARRAAEDLLHPGRAEARRTAAANVFRFSVRSGPTAWGRSGRCQVCGGLYRAGEPVLFVVENPPKVERASYLRDFAPKKGSAHVSCERWCSR